MTPVSLLPSSAESGASPISQVDAAPSRPIGTTAVVYCEGNFGELDGKTANGLVRHSDRYQVLSVIDSRRAGSDAGAVLDGAPNGIPVHRDLRAAIAALGGAPDHFIFGVAPASGLLSPTERAVVLDAIALGMHIVNGLHEFLNEDPEFVAASVASNVTLTDVRRPRPKKDLRVFSGRIFDVVCPRIAVLGTDGAIGKRTTATLLTQALNARGINAVMVGTGQTSLIQGAKHGVALDAIAPQFCSGELEAAVVDAAADGNPDVIIVEGQGALSHPAYLTSAYILRGSQPAGVVLQHAPKRLALSDYPTLPMPTPASEINLIQTFASTTVIGLTLNHEHMTGDEIEISIADHEALLGIPVCDPLTSSPDRLVEMVLAAFPELEPAEFEPPALEPAAAAAGG